MFSSNLARGSYVLFHTQDSAILKATKAAVAGESWQGQVELRFPSIITSPVSWNVKQLLPRTLQGCEAVAAHTTGDGDRLIVELESAREVETLEPCLQEIVAGPGAVVVTAKGTAQSPFDFVSRFFAPKFGIAEDPVCGTAHCALAPLWAARLGKDSLLAYQASNRGGVLDLFVDHASNCVLLRGTAVVVAAGLLLA